MQVINDFKTSVERALTEIDPRWRDYEGLVVCGSHTPVNIDYTIQCIQEARLNGTPFLGICFGLQLAWIEWNRNVLGIKDATSEEFGIYGTFVVKKRPELKVGLHEGESWWSNYFCEGAESWDTPDNYFLAAFHPEYQSTKDKPHKLLVSFLEYAKVAN